MRRVHIGKAPNKKPPVHAMAGFRKGERAGTLEDDDNGLRRGLFLSQAACPVIECRMWASDPGRERISGTTRASLRQTIGSLR